MATQSFKLYDSGNFPTLQESIDHSKLNPLLFNKFASSFSVNFKYKNIEIESFKNSLTDFSSFLKNEAVEGTFNVSETFKPELTAKRLYDSSDLYYVCLVVNGCLSRADYSFNEKSTYFYVPSTKIQIISKFLTISDANFISKRFISLDDSLTVFK